MIIRLKTRAAILLALTAIAWTIVIAIAHAAIALAAYLGA